jgi:hypothetical protein
MLFTNHDELVGVLGMLFICKRFQKGFFNQELKAG